MTNLRSKRISFIIICTSQVRSSNKDSPKKYRKSKSKIWRDALLCLKSLTTNQKQRKGIWVSLHLSRNSLSIHRWQITRKKWRKKESSQRSCNARVAQIVWGSLRSSASKTAGIWRSTKTPNSWGSSRTAPLHPILPGNQSNLPWNLLSNFKIQECL